MTRNEQVRAAIQEFLAMTKGEGGAHPEPDKLVAYHEGGLSFEDERRVQDHLLGCRECAALLADYDGLTDPDFGSDEDIPESAVEVIWDKVREEIKKDPLSLSNVVPFKRPEARPSKSPRWLQPLAAMLLISTMALSAWVANLRDRVKELSSPQPNAPVLDLYPAGSTRGEGGPAVQAVPSDVRLFTIILNPPGRTQFEAYEVEILDVEGNVVRSERGLEPNRFGSFSLTVPRDVLGAGDFRIRLVGIGPEGARQALEEYALRIEGE
ncbi:MAG TPA: zf-HC2 domain-containing protein [Thermoanaerobaculia bacterium]|nr:zf-HC2 domain-containing protein [Thermoanaerobaculia bacterium]